MNRYISSILPKFISYYGFQLSNAFPIFTAASFWAAVVTWAEVSRVKIIGKVAEDVGDCLDVHTLLQGGDCGDVVMARKQPSE